MVTIPTSCSTPSNGLSLLHRVVDEGLKRVEKDQAAMEAALVRMTSTENGDRESSPDHFDV